MQWGERTRSIGAGGGACSFAGGGLFDDGSKARGYCLQYLKVISGKGVRASAVEGQHSGHAGAAFERHRQRRAQGTVCLLYTSPSPRDRQKSRMPSSA